MRLKGTKVGMLWVDRVGDRCSQAILTRDFLVKNSTQEKVTKFREHLSKSLTRADTPAKRATSVFGWPAFGRISTLSDGSEFSGMKRVRIFGTDKSEQRRRFANSL